MKICLYSPYVPKHTGGGEKHFFDVARVLAEKHQVFVAIPEAKIDDTKIREKYQYFLDASLAKISLISTPLGTKSSFLKKLFWTRQFDVLYYVTDGSLFFSLAAKNILHIQIPFTQPKETFLERMKLNNWQIKNSNSEFTKKIVEKSWQTKIGYVLHPLVEVPTAQHQKEKIILNVGRFFRQLHSKRQDVLVEIFKELRQKYPKESADWKLVLIGTVEDQKYAQEITSAAAGQPIEILHHASRTELNTWYSRASIYWHATGYQVDEATNPEKVEHFGISTVEAMANNCVPIVVGKGGQVEAVGEKLKELLWQTKEECIQNTLPYLKDPQLVVKTGEIARQQAQTFSESAFSKTLAKMLGETQ